MSNNPDASTVALASPASNGDLELCWATGTLRTEGVAVVGGTMLLGGRCDEGGGSTLDTGAGIVDGADGTIDGSAGTVEGSVGSVVGVGVGAGGAGAVLMVGNAE